MKPQKANLFLTGEEVTYHINLVNQYKTYEAVTEMKNISPHEASSPTATNASRSAAAINTA